MAAPGRLSRSLSAINVSWQWRQSKPGTCIMDSPSGSGEIDLVVFVYGRIGLGAVPTPECIPFEFNEKI
jgi:hypothetical protein